MIGGMVAKQTIVIRRGQLGDDGRGNVTVDWTVPVDATSRGWAVDAGDTTEDNVNRVDGKSVAYTLRGPFRADIRSDDRVILFGGEYEVFGGVVRQPGPIDLVSHTIVRLSRWEG